MTKTCRSIFSIALSKVSHFRYFVCEIFVLIVNHVYAQTEKKLATHTNNEIKNKKRAVSSTCETRVFSVYATIEKFSDIGSREKFLAAITRNFTSKNPLNRSLCTFFLCVFASFVFIAVFQNVTTDNM